MLKNDVAAMMNDMIKSSLSDCGVVSNPHPQQSSLKEPLEESSQDSEDHSETEDTSCQGDPEFNEGNPELNQYCLQ